VVVVHAIGEEAAGRATVQGDMVEPADMQTPTASQVATTKTVPVHRAVAALATNPVAHAIVQVAASAILVVATPAEASPQTPVAAPLSTEATEHCAAICVLIKATATHCSSFTMMMV